MKKRVLWNLVPLTVVPSLLIWINVRLAQKKAPEEVAKILTYRNYGDKVSHVVIYGLFTFLILHFGEKLFAAIKNRVTFRIVLSIALFLLITLEEFSQRSIASRSFSYTDLACSYIGFSFALGGFLLLKNISELIRLREKR